VTLDQELRYAAGPNRPPMLVFAVYARGRSCEQILPEMKTRRRLAQLSVFLNRVTTAPNTASFQDWMTAHPEWAK